MLNENSVLNTVYTSANYDIGHVFGRATSGGSGVAQLSAICAGGKYRGVSTTSSPTASFWIGLATHEVGHMFR